MVKTRYLQISDIIMFEYNMLGADDVCSIENPNFFSLTKLLDGHNLLLTPISYECESAIDSSTGETYYKRLEKPLSYNNLNHIAVPKSKDNSMFYYFIDNDYKYVDGTILNALGNYNQQTNRKLIEYNDYLVHPVDKTSSVKFMDFATVSNVRWDNMKLYFVNGYDFSNIYGLYVKIYVDKMGATSENGDYVDLCDFFVTKENYYKLIKYLSSPIIFGNNIYDRYIELNLPCVYDLINNKDASISTLFNILDIKSGSTLKLSFAYVLSEDKEIDNLEYDIATLGVGTHVSEPVNLTFTKSSSIKGTIPTENINSDNLGCYIAECQDKPYIEFYGTWRDNPLTSPTVWKFNKGIRLYDTSLVQRDSTYEIDDAYQAQYNMRKWVAMHEIKLSFCMDDTVIKEETYNMSQVFVSNNEDTKFYYRPMIFDENTGLFINNIQIVYTMRFINVDDKVQFVKVASLSIVGDCQKYYAKGTSLKLHNTNRYFVYNKIVENKQEIVNSGTGTQSTKYVKVFYDATNVMLDKDGEQYGTYSYTLTCSQSPKNYKFVFKKAQDNGAYDYMDLTNGYYKLTFKDVNGADVVIEPTFSSNMNLYLGELEFNLTSANINKMIALEDDRKKMSIIAYGEDGSVSSMYDFNFSF